MAGWDDSAVAVFVMCFITAVKLLDVEDIDVYERDTSLGPLFIGR